MMAPFTPHIAEEIWSEFGGQGTILDAGWPTVNPEALKEDALEIVLQVNGKMRGKITLPAGLDRAALEAAAREAPEVRKHTAGLTIAKVIVVPGKLVNIVAK